jgi:hypothetical protein
VSSVPARAASQEVETHEAAPHPIGQDRRSVGRARHNGEFKRAKRTLDEGENEWTWVLVLLADYAIAIPLFLLMLLAAELAYHFA